jgi:putative serine protease PepD
MSVNSSDVEAEEGRDDEGPRWAWLPPEDRLWRHPSEIGPRPAAASGATWRRSTAGHSWTSVLAAGVIGALLASGVGMATGIFSHRPLPVRVPVPTPETTAAATTSAADPNGGWPAVANAIAPSLVGIDAGGQMGTGVVYTAFQDSTYILTASDVVSGDHSVDVVWEDGAHQRGSVVGSDPVSGIAVLSVAGAGHPTPVFGSAADLQVASGVLAVAARSTGPASVAPGNLSGLDTELKSPGGYDLEGMLAITGLTVPPPADGGALVDRAGEVVGIDTDLTSVSVSMQDIAFAVPIDTAERVADEIIAGEEPTDPWIGVLDATDLSTTTASQLHIAGGAAIGSVAAGSPAYRAGIRAGDIVTSFDGQQVTSAGELVRVLATARTGERTTVSYVGRGRLHRAAITVESARGPG